jgi:hypothetical protein
MNIERVSSQLKVQRTSRRGIHSYFVRCPYESRLYIVNDGIGTNYSVNKDDEY